MRGRNILVAGDPRSGKSWAAGLVSEHLVLLGYSLCIVDPEGDYASLEALPGVVALGGAAPVPRPSDVTRMLHHADSSVVLDLSRMPHGAKTDYLRELLPHLLRFRQRTGLRERFRATDAALWAFLDDRATPVVLAGVPDHHGTFRSVRGYPHLLDDGVEEDVANLHDLHARTWRTAQRHHETIEQLAASQYVSASLCGEASDRIDEVAAAAEGRIGLLLHREGAHVAGSVDPLSRACDLAPAMAGRGGSDVTDALCGERDWTRVPLALSREARGAFTRGGAPAQGPRPGSRGRGGTLRA